MKRSNTIALCLCLAGAPACEDSGASVLGVEATGTVVGLAFVDRDGDEILDPSIDGPAAGVRVHLVRGERDTLRRTATDAGGLFEFVDVPVGAYRVATDSLPAGLRLVWIREASVTVAASDTAATLIALGYPRLTLSESRAAELVGRIVSVEGVALNSWQSFGDSTLHLADRTGTLRAARVQPVDLPQGYRTRVSGTLSVRDGQPIIADAIATVLGPGTPPEPVTLSTDSAATAADGTLDGGLARIEAAVIQTAVVSGRDFLLTVDDGTGPLDVLLDADLPFVVDEAYAPGGVLAATGLLVAAPGSRWRLKPRSPMEVAATITPIGIAQARGMAPGAKVVVEGVALHGWGAFGDSTLHVMDGVGAIRAVGVPPLVAVAGSRLRVHGTVARQDGQPVLREVTARLLGSDTLPSPVAVSTREASTAAAGTLDAMPVRVADAAILDGELTVHGDLLLRVSDGSGRLEVLLDQDIAFDLASVSPGALLDAEGVLVPGAPDGAWRLLPRAPGDIRATYPTLSLAEARAAPMGKRVWLVGVALNGLQAFGDATLHLSDDTGVLRAVGLAPAYILAGDSVRLLGTIGAVEGQPVLRSERVSVLGPGAAPAPRPSTTSVAAEADGGALDAALVEVAGAVVTDTATTAGGDFLLTVDDESGPLEVLLDRDAGFAFGSYRPEQVLRVTGLLVPAGGGSAGWRLKPRSSVDVKREDGP